MSRASTTKTENVRSSLLSLQESEALEKLLGRRCASTATAVAQLFMALPHNPSTWSLQHTGVVCLIKDNPQRSYFFRMYDLKAGRQLWEQELYNQIVYSASPQLYFHTFAADDCQVGLNFAQQQEAEAFRNAVVGKINQRSNRQERGSLPPVPPDKTSGSRSSFHKASADIPSPDIAPRYRLMRSASSLRAGKGKKDKKDKKKGLSKADIGAPSGFKHVSHVGFDPNNLDPDLCNLLSQAGIGEDEMRDEQTSQLVYNIIERSGGMEAVKREVHRGAAGPPPPPPGRQGPLPPVPGSANSVPTPPRGRSGPLPPIPVHSQRAPRGAVPPPPPSNRGCPPPAQGPPPPSSKSSPVPSSGSAHNAPPPVPPPHHQRTAGFLPPTAPCPPSRGVCGDPAPPPPPLPPPPLQLPSDPRTPPPAPFGSQPPPAASSLTRADTRGALLDQIRLGKKLRNVSECQDQMASPPAESSEGIVGALMMVMHKRSKVIHSSDESEEEGAADEDDDDEWDD
ncbi:WASP actin nucleation promoting factor b isoform X1 [Phycodurus eques]|uniref:WASP actin nucleation promoting factor b isoform X1 n=2 Tax=Phycodurus eques TaxID=693459 RepID=UPI002ACD96CE|nr:WASP actin nucleation promoting factor b isoform X1 [Phycodurus eques]